LVKAIEDDKAKIENKSENKLKKELFLQTSCMKKETVNVNHMLSELQRRRNKSLEGVKSLPEIGSGGKDEQFVSVKREKICFEGNRQEKENKVIAVSKVVSAKRDMESGLNSRRNSENKLKLNISEHKNSLKMAFSANRLLERRQNSFDHVEKSSILKNSLPQMSLNSSRQGLSYFEKEIEGIEKSKQALQRRNSETNNMKSLLQERKIQHDNVLKEITEVKEKEEKVEPIISLKSGCLKKKSSFSNQDRAVTVERVRGATPERLQALKIKRVSFREVKIDNRF